MALSFFQSLHAQSIFLFLFSSNVLSFNLIALRKAKTLLSFGLSECNRVKLHEAGVHFHVFPPFSIFHPSSHQSISLSIHSYINPCIKFHFCQPIIPTIIHHGAKFLVGMFSWHMVLSFSYLDLCFTLG